MGNLYDKVSTIRTVSPALSRGRRHKILLRVNATPLLVHSWDPQRPRGSEDATDAEDSPCAADLPWRLSAATLEPRPRVRNGRRRRVLVVCAMAVSLADDGPQRPSDDGATRRAGVHRPGTLGAQVQVRAGLEHHRHPLGFALPAHQTLLLQKDVLAELFHF